MKAKRKLRTFLFITNTRHLANTLSPALPVVEPFVYTYLLFFDYKWIKHEIAQFVVFFGLFLVFFGLFLVFFGLLSGLFCSSCPLGLLSDWLPDTLRV